MMTHRIVGFVALVLAQVVPDMSAITVDGFAEIIGARYDIHGFQLPTGQPHARAGPIATNGTLSCPSKPQIVPD